MGRSVMTLSDATAIAYDYLEPDEEFYREKFDEEVKEGYIDEDEDFDNWMWKEYNDFGAQSDFESYLEDIQYTVARLWPSFEEADEWIGNEIHVIAKNAHSIVTISEYSGSVSICLGPNYDRGDFWYDDSSLSGLGEAWRKKISERFVQTFGSMAKIGTASNGESFFEKVS